MNPVKSKSGNITGCRKEDDGTLSVKFKNGGIYNYPNLDAQHVEHFIKIADTDESSGSYFAQHIRAEKFKKLEK